MRLRKIGGKVIACACLSLSVLMCVPMSAAHAAIPVDTNYAQWDYKPFIYPSSEKNKPDFDSILSDPNKSEDDMIKVRNLGKKSLKEVKEKLIELGLGFKPID